MPFKEHTLLRSSVEIRIRCPDAADKTAIENAVITQTVERFDFWFGNALIDKKYEQSLDEHENVKIQIVFIVFSSCTTERLDMYIVSAISHARNLAEKIGRDRVDMFVNNSFIPI